MGDHFRAVKRKLKMLTVVKNFLFSPTEFITMYLYINIFMPLLLCKMHTIFLYESMSNIGNEN